MQGPIVIAGTEIRGGQRVTIDIPFARLYTHTDMTMPVHVIHGKKPGPRLFISAAIHGDEINGVEIIRRLLKLRLLNKLRGTLIAIPVVNAYGFINHSRYLPDGRDLNRFFPGNSKGSLTSQLASLFMDEIVSKCTHGIDMHTGSRHRNNLPQIRADLSLEENETLASAFGAPVVIDARLRDGSLREAASEIKIPLLLYEAGEALRFNDMAIKMGIKGIISVMRKIGNLPPRMAQGKRQMEPLLARSTKWTRAPISGIVQSAMQLGTKVEKGDVVAVVGDPFGESEENVVASSGGVLIGRLNLPLVHRGDALFNIASVDMPDDMENALEIIDLPSDGDYDIM
ncbi:MAG: succinylglutamate desuccinylase/aspartoacylase family protein [bacterium]|nr:succinylglutamate desuccinylase/aspartoacylase family protein [bacterium]